MLTLVDTSKETSDCSERVVSGGRFIADTALEPVKKSNKTVAQSGRVFFGDLFCVARLKVFPPSCACEVCRQTRDNQRPRSVAVLTRLRVFNECKEILGMENAGSVANRDALHVKPGRTSLCHEAVLIVIHSDTNRN